MFINPKTAIERGWIAGNINEKHIQPNAIDFTLDTLYKINATDTFIIAESAKLMRKSNQVVHEELVHSSFVEGTQGWWLQPNSVYDGTSEFVVDIPEGVAALLIVRSTLNRNGLFITSGLYDSGFKGHIGVAIHNRLGDAFLEKGVRIGQIIFVASENAGVYSGGYNHEKGTHWTEG